MARHFKVQYAKQCLLKYNDMLILDVVFVDTSVFIAENFFANGNRINSLCKLAKERKIRR